MIGQLKRLGCSFDYERTFFTCEPEIYKWSQWLFLALLSRDLVYRARRSVTCCESCNSVLNPDQVVNGGCWRCQTPAQIQQRNCWYLRASAYSKENDLRTGALQGWNPLAVATQVEALGRIEGVAVRAETIDGKRLSVFTPHQEAAEDAQFVLLSPMWPDIGDWVDSVALRELETLLGGCQAKEGRNPGTAPLLDTGKTVICDGSSTAVPVWVSPYVEARFGPIAYLGVPSADPKDQILADRVGSSQPSGEPLDKKIIFDSTSVYRAGDFPISRPRWWGTPIPIINCADCGTVSVPEDDLPVALPAETKLPDENVTLEAVQEFVFVLCPRCGKRSRRETDTLDSHFDALWMWLPALVPVKERYDAMFDKKRLARWVPVSKFIAGSDSSTFVLNHRTCAKALRDIGPFSFLSDGEPFAGCLVHHLVTSDGKKMSKRTGGTPPDELVTRYGADAVRMAVLYATKPEKNMEWSENAVRYSRRFIEKVWEYVMDWLGKPSGGTGEDQETTAPLRRRLHKWRGAAIRRTTRELEEAQMHRAVRNLHLYFERIKYFQERVEEDGGGPLQGEDAAEHHRALTTLLMMLAPLVPHMAEELLERMGAIDHGVPLGFSWPNPDDDEDSPVFNVGITSAGG
jgi:leucyl-tRNA synthetase